MNVTIAERNRLVVENLALVRFFVKRRRVPPWLVDDAMQAGAMGLLRAIEKYEPDHPSGSTLSGYAGRWIMAYIGKTTERCMRLADVEALDENLLVLEPDDDLLLLSKRHQLRGWLAELPARHLEIVARRIHGESNEEIGRQMRPKLSRERVRQLERDAYDQIRRIARRRNGPLAEALRIGA